MDDLGCITNVEVIKRLISVDGKRVVDAGCGSMTVSRMLAELGASVIAVDPDSIQAEKNRAAEPTPNVEFVEAGAESIPVDDGSIDGVFFSYSLHHIPESIYPEVFQEVFRILKPDGFLYVIEPIDCPLNQVMKLFHDEDVERAAAQSALHEIAVPAFKEWQEVTYHGWTEYESFEAFVRKFSFRSFNSNYTEANVSRDEVRAAFELHGAPDYRFQSPKSVMCCKGLRR